MNQETIENPNSTNEGGEGEAEIDTLTEEQLAELSAEERLARVEKGVADFQKKNQELFARAKKAEERNKRLREAIETEEDKPTEPPPPKNETEESRFERIDLRLAGYDEDEVNYLMTLGGKHALERQEVKDLMEFKRQKKQQEKNTPTPSSRSVPVLDKTPLRELSSNDEGQKKIKENWEQVTAKFKKKGIGAGGVI